jgi:hypothetical protein
MAYAIDLMKNVPKPSVDKSIESHRLSHLLLLTIGYSPDRGVTELVKNYPVNDQSFIKMSTDIQTALGRLFLQELYVDRIERNKIEGYTPTKHPIILYGLPGVGKTVLALKVCEEINHMGIERAMYFDFKSIGDAFYKNSQKGFVANFREVIFHSLLKEFVENSEDRIEQWIKYKIIEDPRYIAIKDLILDLWRKPLVGDDWLNILDEPQVKREYERVDRSPDLNILLKFIKTFQQLVLCFDNADRFALEEQCMILESCIHLSNSTEISIIITLRTANLRRITAEGAKGDMVFVDRLDTLPAKAIEVDKIREENAESNESLRTLFHKRFDFIRKNKAYADFGKHYRDLVGKEGWDYSPGQYVQQFWNIYTAIGNTFAEEDIFQYCNYSIREIAVLYFEYINKLIIEPEERYTFKKLFPSNTNPDITNLRNYLYKWLICNGNTLPSLDSRVLNIFERDKTKSTMLFIRLLAYLYNNQCGNNGLPFEDIADDLWGLGIDKAELREAVRFLTKDQHYNEKTLIWVDKAEEEKIDDAKILIMPAGRYFIEKLSISRDYVFWMLLITDLSQIEMENIFGKKTINYSSTYDDTYRTLIVYNFLDYKLVPEFIDTAKQLTPIYREDNSEFSNNLERIRGKFSIHGKCYLERLIESVMNSINFSSMGNNEKEEMKNKYSLLLKKMKQMDTTSPHF